MPLQFSVGTTWRSTMLHPALRMRNCIYVEHSIHAGDLMKLAAVESLVAYRQRRWPDWDPDETEWQPLHMDEQPQTWWQAVRGAGLGGVHWLRRYRQRDALLDSQYRTMLFDDRYRAERAAMRSAAGIDDEPGRDRVAPTERQMIRSRIRCRPYGAVFWNHEVSDDVLLADEVLLESSAEPDSGLEEFAPGFWCYGLPPSMIAYGEGPMMLSPAYVGLRYAGPGSGFASMHALNKVGWATQMTAKCRLAVMAETPEPLSPVVVHEYGDNRARLDLSWAEVTFIEAMHTIGMAERSTDEIIESMYGETMIRRIGSTATIRRDETQSVFRSEQEIRLASDTSLDVLRDQHREKQDRILEAMPEAMSAMNHPVASASTRFWQQAG